jgi:hypothetical protein
MMQEIDPVRFNAFVRLLTLPDPADLPRRGHVYRYQGDPNRRSTRLPGILMAWLQRRHLAVDEVRELPTWTTPAVRRHARQASIGLRLLRPTGTG